MQTMENTNDGSARERVHFTTFLLLIVTLVITARFKCRLRSFFPFRRYRCFSIICVSTKMAFVRLSTKHQAKGKIPIATKKFLCYEIQPINIFERIFSIYEFIIKRNTYFIDFLLFLWHLFGNFVFEMVKNNCCLKLFGEPKREKNGKNQ